MAEAPPDPVRDGPPRVLLIGALALAVAAIVTVLAIAAARQAPRQPVAIAAVPAPQAEDPACRSLLEAAPQRLGDYQRVRAVDPAPAGAAAWQGEPGTEPVVLRCGLDRPAEFVMGSPIQVVDDVQWFRVGDTGADGSPSDRSTWFTVDRPIYVALTLPAGSGPAPIQQLSETIAAPMPSVPIDPPRPGG